MDTDAGPRGDLLQSYIATLDDEHLSDLLRQLNKTRRRYFPVTINLRRSVYRMADARDAVRREAAYRQI